MKIAVLSECFLNEDHLKRLTTLGEVLIFNDTTTETQAIKGPDQRKIYGEPIQAAL